ncbi:hypothetical protein CRE_06019 [Caenorhabditis remanei]|uniref:Uncharacterized protein n=1 Tax=Caenorhabditis remanei TaxID=31234 RepID=E3N6I9_CAERE|nr:hypothetical protein CRE_06019 [Caenorhabditis remanei]
MSNREQIAMMLMNMYSGIRSPEEFFGMGARQPNQSMVSLLELLTARQAAQQAAQPGASPPDLAPVSPPVEPVEPPTPPPSLPTFEPPELPPIPTYQLPSFHIGDMHRVFLFEKYSQGTSAIGSYRELCGIPEPEAKEDSESEDESDIDVEEVPKRSLFSNTSYSDIDFWYNRFMNGNYSMDREDNVKEKPNPFEKPKVQELIAKFSDSWTLANLQQVSSSFREVARSTPINITKVKVQVDTENIRMQVFDGNYRQWTNIEYHNEEEGCRYQVGKRSRIMPKLNFHRVFMSDFKMIARHPMLKLEELDFDIVQDRFPMYLEWIPYKFFKNCAMSCQKQIPCKKFSITVDECYDDYKDPAAHLLKMCEPGVETVMVRVMKRAWPPSDYNAKFDGRNFFTHKMRDTTQWGFANNLIFESDFYDIEIRPGDGIKEFTLNNICHNTMREMVQNFTINPLEHDITINLKGELLMSCVDRMVVQNLEGPVPRDRVCEFPVLNHYETFSVQFTGSQILLKRHEVNLEEMLY